MEGNNITSNLLHDISYSSLTTVLSTEQDSRILATSHVMYKIGRFGYMKYMIQLGIKSVRSGHIRDRKAKFFFSAVHWWNRCRFNLLSLPFTF